MRTFKEYRSTDYAAKNPYSEFDDAYSSFSDDLSDVMHIFDDRALATQVLQRAPQEQQHHNQNQAQRRPEFRLPNISIPVFAGDYASWSAFNNMFVSLINSNASFTNFEKFHYLKSNIRMAKNKTLVDAQPEIIVTHMKA